MKPEGYKAATNSGFRKCNSNTCRDTCSSPEQFSHVYISILAHTHLRLMTGICPMHCKTRCFPIILFLLPLLPHSPSAYPISLLNPTHSHPAICRPSSSRCFPCRVGLWEAATDRKEKPTETPEKNHFFTWKSRFHRAAFPPGERVVVIKGLGGKTPHFLPRFYPENQAGTQALKRRVLSLPNRCWTYKGGQRPGRKEGGSAQGKSR